MGRLSWQYYGGMTLSTDESACPLRLVTRPRDRAPDPNWQVLWQGSRPREDDEIFVLERRKTPPSP